MQPTRTLHERQIWALPTYTSRAHSSYCSPITLAANGIISFGSDNVVTLTTNVIFQPLCTTAADSTNRSVVAISPFYASATPQVFVVSAATVLAWVLVIMLLISPRTYLNTLSGGPSPHSVGMGIIGGAHGGASSVGIGSRPWLQKAAALTVAISLTIATADTFRQSERHYPAGIDGNSMRALVENSLEIRITRLISDVFVWLAQVQTLIRLFPRHKEKVIIKWIGFALIVLDTTFACLNSFMVARYARPREFVNAIPALSYLFELALSLLYAAWVFYFAFSKRRYAFYYPKMKTICLIALLSTVALLTPVVFFVTDITLPNIAGWGDYFRWVGAAAASVVVWEWVERIEILERDEKKDGILGREVFDGDEMLDLNPRQEMTYNARRYDDYFPRGDGSSGRGAGSAHDASHKFNIKFSSPFSRSRFGRRNPAISKVNSNLDNEKQSGSDDLKKEISADTSEASMDPPRTSPMTPPVPTITPPSRAQTVSAASTVYVVRHDGTSDIQPVRRRMATPDQLTTQRTIPDEREEDDEIAAVEERKTTEAWYGVKNPFKRKRTTPPAEIRSAIRLSQEVERGITTGSRPQNKSRAGWDIGSKVGGVRARAIAKGKDKSSMKKSEEELPWTVIPAQPRGVTWTPSPVNNQPAPLSGARNNSRDPSPIPERQGQVSPAASPPRSPSNTSRPPAPAITPQSIDARISGSSNGPGEAPT